MPKEIDILCTFPHGQEVFTFKIGQPNSEHHPLFFQEKWLKEFKNGVIPQEFINSLKKLYDLAKENNTSFEELASYAVTSQQKKESINAGFKNYNLTKYADEFFKQENSNLGLVENLKNETKENTEVKQITEEKLQITTSMNNNINEDDLLLLNDNFNNGDDQSINVKNESIYGEDSDLL